ncbi:MAG: biotin transporter BioY [Candidatus Zixiibacteriota bacterium]|nr:MAG: biotin transporter BioY [candidate division Zixibacteria bacterium]
MNSSSHAITIYDRIRPSSLLAELPILIGFNLLLIACAQVVINLPFVPITGQTFGVLLVAMALGRVRGLAVISAYLLEGILGLPVFAQGKAGVVALLGPTGGYLMGFAVAGYLVGWLADRGWHQRYSLSVLAMIIGTVVIYLCGVVWLTRFVPTGSLLAVGVTPFIAGGLVKIGLAAIILPTVWKLVRK